MFPSCLFACTNSLWCASGGIIIIIIIIQLICISIFETIHYVSYWIRKAERHTSCNTSSIPLLLCECAIVIKISKQIDKQINIRQILQDSNSWIFGSRNVFIFMAFKLKSDDVHINRIKSLIQGSIFPVGVICLVFIATIIIPEPI